MAFWQLGAALLASFQAANGLTELETDRLLRTAALIDRLSAYERASQCSRLFAEASGEELALLRNDDADSVAIQAAWERIVRDTDKRTGEKNESVAPDAGLVHWFLGFVEARSRTSTPDWWRQALLQMRVNGKWPFMRRPWSRKYHDAGRGVKAPEDTRLLLQNGAHILDINGTQIALPKQILDHEGSINNISGCFTETHCFVAIHDHDGSFHSVWCIDRQSGAAVWWNVVCGCTFSSEGYHVSRVSVAVDQQRVIVFGVATGGVYLHAYDARSGETLIQFSSINTHSGHGRGYRPRFVVTSEHRIQHGDPPLKRGSLAARADGTMPAKVLWDLLRNSRQSLLQVHLRKGTLSPQHFSHLAELPGLRDLAISGAPGVLPTRQLRGQPPLNLVSLRLSDCQVDESLIGWAAGMPRLRELYLDIEFDLEDEQTLSRLRHIEHLGLPRKGDLSVDALVGLREFRRLQTLRIPGGHRLHAEHLEQITKLASLEEVTIKHVSSSLDILILADARKLKTLTLLSSHLDLADVERFKARRPDVLVKHTR